MYKKIFITLLTISLFVVSGCKNAEQDTNKNANNNPLDASEVVTGKITVDLKAASQEVKTGDYVKIDANINTNEETVNSLQLILNYNEDLLDFDSISTARSVFTIWMEKKSEAGEIRLSAGEPNPGVKGNDQNVALIVFKAKKDGIAKISLDKINSKIFTSEEINQLKSIGHNNAEITILKNEEEVTTIE